MKNKIALASLAALAAFAGLASTAKADGGIRFGISFGDYGRPAYCAPVYTPPHCAVPEYPAYVQPGYGRQNYYGSPERDQGHGFYNNGGGYGSSYCPPVVDHRPRGYWQDVTVKTWVAGQRFETHDRWGRPVCVEQPGYFAYRTERVWVSNRG